MIANKISPVDARYKTGTKCPYCGAFLELAGKARCEVQDGRDVPKKGPIDLFCRKCWECGDVTKATQVGRR